MSKLPLKSPHFEGIVVTPFGLCNCIYHNWLRFASRVIFYWSYVNLISRWRITIPDFLLDFRQSF